ncbi:MAG: crotonase [OM182 bacterium MED-G24]|uniref:Crotonase n=1 Tax=OM182 bacterium MED-G24 TaxID=1986255 RepID=A0A2A5WL47_9GAMM|nr:MAG: crotonase [OM182 bacterium MED-G24]|tara:strand:+ start:618 stop:1376 length:759 start_codon:yes stop_codon:yes gene_type:complete
MTVVDRQTTDGITTVTLDRPDALNSFNNTVFDELCDTFLAAATDEQCKVLVLTGAGRAFSAGADLKAKGNDITPRHGLAGLLESIIDFPKPFIVAANGLGVGIGCTILGLADVAFAAESARFRCPFSSLGITAEASSTYTFPRLLGHQRASWILLSAEWVSSADAKDAGLVNEVFPDEGFLEAAIDKARVLAALPKDSLIQTKDLIVGPQREAMKAAVRSENAALDRLSGGPANQEAIAAFKEKRTADFSSL